MKKKNAQGLIEYALILALVTLIAISVLSLISRNFGSVFGGNTNIKTQTVEMDLDK